MYLTHLQRWFPQNLFAPPEGAGAGAAGGASSGSGVAASGSSGAGGTGDGAAGAGSQAIALSDDSRIKYGDFEGTHKDFLARYVPREQFDRGVKVLEAEASKLENAWKQYYAGAGKKPDQPDPAAAWRDGRGRLKNVPLVDGSTLADQIDQLEQHGLRPIAQTITALLGRLTAAEKAIQQINPTVASLGQDRTNSQFTNWVGNEIIAKIDKVKGLPEGATLDVSDPFLRDLTSDVYLSHDQQSWGSAKAVREEVVRRAQDAIAWVRRLDAAAKKSGEERRRAAFTNLGKGQGRPTGDQPYKHMKGDQLASMLFGAASNT